MITSYTVQDLKDFETEVGECFKQKLVRAPVHLSDGNEAPMIEVFQSVQQEDWVFCSWRSHYQCLLKGVPRQQVLDDIKNCKSISLCFPEYRVFSSAMVAGNCPIANGVAFELKRKNSTAHVWCWVGEMTSETGAFHENWKYSMAHDLPITWVIEDNSKSVCTDTRATWNLPKLTHEQPELIEINKIIYYRYTSKYPHSGVGYRIQF